MVGCDLVVKHIEKDWVHTLLNSKFFGSCENHHGRRKNEENVFCINCNTGFCRHCVNSHHFHKQLQICKYVYQDVVRLQDIQKHLDCSKIQTYKINGEKAVHLNPRPQAKDSKPSTKAKFGGSCEACRRYLQDLPNRFCSIACKVSVASMDAKNQMESIIPYTVSEFHQLSLKASNSTEEKPISENEFSIAESDLSDETSRRMNFYLKPVRRVHKRKSIPHRAPLF